MYDVHNIPEKWFERLREELFVLTSMYCAGVGWPQSKSDISDQDVIEYYDGVLFVEEDFYDDA